MIQLAFKNAYLAASLESPMGALFSRLVAQFTGGKFSHVEMYFSGPLDKALCFSSREPNGTGFLTLDLTQQVGPDPLWMLVPISATADQEAHAYWFCRGNAQREYDKIGILGIASGNGIHDIYDRFCSEMMIDVMQSVLGLYPDIPRWMVAPSGPHSDGRYGLYELLTGKEIV